MVETIDKVSWNLAAGIIMEIQNLLAKANTNYISGRITKCFHCLKAIKMRIIQNLSQEERLHLKKLEEEIHKKMYALESTSTEDGKEWHIAKGEVCNLVENYNETILDLLDKYGFLIEKKQDYKKMF